MSLLKFFQIIDKSKIGKFIDKKMNVLESTDPDRIYVENIRSFYNIPNFVARFFCEMAVKENLFKKKIAISCPKCGRVVMTTDRVSKIPNEMVCEVCELADNEPCVFIPKERNLLTFYQLSDSR